MLKIDGAADTTSHFVSGRVGEQYISSACTVSLRCCEQCWHHDCRNVPSHVRSGIVEVEHVRGGGIDERRIERPYSAAGSE
jgi:hypothetical protein